MTHSFVATLGRLICSFEFGKSTMRIFYFVILFDLCQQREQKFIVIYSSLLKGTEAGQCQGQSASSKITELRFISKSKFNQFASFLMCAVAKPCDCSLHAQFIRNFSVSKQSSISHVTCNIVATTSFP